tara:strand:- start:51 stop:569 length:519 start_codon:yes stop_codon:yes gene_type:complete
MNKLFENWRRFLLTEAQGNAIYKGYLGWQIPNELVDLAGVDESYIKNRIERDGQDIYHITIINPKETRQIIKDIKAEKGLSGSKAKKEVKSILLQRGESLAQSEFSIGETKSVEGPGDGAVGTEGEPSSAFFKVVEWEEAQALRAEYGLPPKDLHITLGIGDNGDVHGVEKI